MMRLGLCCKFHEAPIKFRTTTAAYLSRIDSPRDHLESIVRDNVQALKQAIIYCAHHGIGSFRISSRILPLTSHPDFRYSTESLPTNLKDELKSAAQLAQSHGIRLTLHPDQFVVINSPRQDVVTKSIEELEYHADLAKLVGADVINVHGGGAYGDKKIALERLVDNAARLSQNVRSKLTLENDDRTYTPEDLLPVCHELQVPFVYDVHHHRCLPDSLSIEDATEKALATWDREPLFHLSSPANGWDGPNPRKHHDYIDIGDFPSCWKGLDVTVEVEAKAKENAVLRLLKQL